MKLLYLENLCEYFLKNNVMHYSANENQNQPLYVQAPGTVNFSKDDDNSEGLMYAELHVCHTEENVNGSYISKETMEKALPSLKDRPIMGYLHQVDNEWQFWGHNMTLNEDGDIEYQEIPVGHFSESRNPELVYDKKNKKTYVVAQGVIYEDYTHAADVLRREGQCSVSVELAIRDLVYDTDKKVLVLKDFYFSGCTILGIDDAGNEIRPGMTGSHITIDAKDVSKFTLSSEEAESFIIKDHLAPNSIYVNGKLVETLEKLNTTLSTFNNIQNIQEGGGTVKLQELLDKYNKAIEDITFEFEGLTDEELESKFAEVFAEDEDEDNKNDIKNPEEDSNEDLDGVEGEDEKEEDIVINEENNTASTPEINVNQLQKSIGFDGATKNFEISLNDVVFALHRLVQVTYGEADDTYYDVQVYDDNLVMIDCCGMHAYRQGYLANDGEYSLVGERVEVFAHYMTKEEEAKFEAMKADYEKYVAKDVKQQKEALLSSTDYESIRDTEEFVNFSNDVQMIGNEDKYSVSDVNEKLDEMLLNYAKKYSKHADSSKPRTKAVKIPEATEPVAKGPYGSLFSKYSETIRK